MNTNLNQLLKDLEIGPAYVKILICLLGCTFMLYPTFFHFTCFFRELPVYEQVLFTSGSSALYTGVGILLSAISPVSYPRILYTPLAMLSSSVMISKYSINSLVYWVTYVHNVVYSFYRSMIYCYINSTQRCAGSIVIDIIPTNGADKRKFFPFAPYFPVTNVIKRYFYPYFPAIIGIKGYSFPYFPYLSGIMKIKTALYSLFSRLDWHKTVVFPCLGEIYEGIRSLSWEIPVT